MRAAIKMSRERGNVRGGGLGEGGVVRRESEKDVQELGGGAEERVMKGRRRRGG